MADTEPWFSALHGSLTIIAAGVLIGLGLCVLYVGLATLCRIWMGEKEPVARKGGAGDAVEGTGARPLGLGPGSVTARDDEDEDDEDDQPRDWMDDYAYGRRAADSQPKPDQKRKDDK